jgi:hypothetical protein|tara:strand:+ start:653 stop:1312 length:660 start_codon:yes stop_codon:yes gene_type:complete
MKIKLTEHQYNRLLTEDTSHEDWGRLSKNVDQFTIKIFNYIRKKITDSQLKMNIDIVNFLTNDMQLTQEESIILIHNFKKMVNYNTMTEEVDELMGEPLEYIRIWEIPTHIPTTIEISGRGDPMGIVYALGKNTQDALKNVKDGNNFEIGELYDDEIDINDFDLEIDEIHTQTEMVSDDFYDGDTNDGKFIVKPFVGGDRLGYKERLSPRSLESLISKI